MIRYDDAVELLTREWLRSSALHPRRVRARRGVRGVARDAQLGQLCGRAPELCERGLVAALCLRSGPTARARQAPANLYTGRYGIGCSRTSIVRNDAVAERERTASAIGEPQLLQNVLDVHLHRSLRRADDA